MEDLAKPFSPEECAKSLGKRLVWMLDKRVDQGNIGDYRAT